MCCFSREKHPFGTVPFFRRGLQAGTGVKGPRLRYDINNYSWLCFCIRNELMQAISIQDLVKRQPLGLGSNNSSHLYKSCNFCSPFNVSMADMPLLQDAAQYLGGQGKNLSPQQLSTPPTVFLPQELHLTGFQIFRLCRSARACFSSPFCVLNPSIAQLNACIKRACRTRLACVTSFNSGIETSILDELRRSCLRPAAGYPTSECVDVSGRGEVGADRLPMQGALHLQGGSL